jgi:hypothetical protein
VSGASASAILIGVLSCIGVEVVTGCCGARERRSGWSGRIQDGGASGYKAIPASARIEYFGTSFREVVILKQQQTTSSYRPLSSHDCMFKCMQSGSEQCIFFEAPRYKSLARAAHH